MLLFVSLQTIRAQNAPVTSIGNVSMSSSTITVTITAVNFTNIGSCNLKIIYDPGIVLATGAAIDPLLGGNMNVNLTVPGEIFLGWYTYPGKTVGNNSVIFTISFQRLNSGTTTLSFSDNGNSCKYYNGNWNELIDIPSSDYYINGSITVPPITKLNGQLTYNNAANTPLNGATIQLLNSSKVVVATTTTALYTDYTIPGNPVISGYYEFSGINNGNYTLRASLTQAWGGVNSTDALHVKLHTIGLMTLNGLAKVAADVNLSNTVNSTDALFIQLRTVGIINQFAAADWSFEDTLVNVNGLTLHNFKALATGDVDKSYIPSSGNKVAVSNNLKKEGLIMVSNNQDIEFAVRVNDFLSLSAITLNLNYNQNLIDVNSLTSPFSGLNYTINNGKIRIAWSDVNPVSLQADDILIMLKVRAKANINSSTDLLSYDHTSEFADEKGNIIPFSTLKTNSIETQSEHTTIYVFPNPFKENMEINYSIKETGNVRIWLYNSVGQKIGILEDAVKEVGFYNIHFNTSHLQSGIYICEIIINGETSIDQKHIELVKTK